MGQSESQTTFCAITGFSAVVDKPRKWDSSLQLLTNDQNFSAAKTKPIDIIGKLRHQFRVERPSWLLQPRFNLTGCKFLGCIYLLINGFGYNPYSLPEPYG